MQLKRSRQIVLRDAPKAVNEKKLLLLSYHFPPGHSVGALRWEKLSAFASSAGWDIDVVTCAPQAISKAAAGRLSALPPGLRVFGVRERHTWIEHMVETLASVRRLAKGKWTRGAPTLPRAGASRPHAAPQSIGRLDSHFSPFSKRDYLRALHAWVAVEHELAWARDAARVSRELLASHEYQALITCGPPHACHFTGGLLARRAGIPHIMDLRDPWSLVERVNESVASPLLFQRFSRLERSTVRNASLIVMNTERAHRAMAQLHKSAASRIVTVMNGFDDEGREPNANHRTDAFRVAFAGTIYLDRDPRPLFRAAALVVRQLGLTPDDFSLEFMGDVMSYDRLTLTEIAEGEGLVGFVRTHAAGSREQALAFLSTAAMLISLPQDSDMAIPSKIFEYMLFDAWLLAFATPDSATAELLTGSGAHVVAPTDVPAIARVLVSCVEAHRRGERPARLADHARFGRKEQARTLLLKIGDVIRTQSHA